MVVENSIPQNRTINWIHHLIFTAAQNMFETTRPDLSQEKMWLLGLQDSIQYDIYTYDQYQSLLIY